MYELIFGTQAVSGLVLGEAKTERFYGIDLKCHIKETRTPLLLVACLDHFQRLCRWLLPASFKCCSVHCFPQAFPLIPAPGGENAGFTECARYHLAAKPRKGDGEGLAVAVG